jgi:urease accessory protein
MNTAVSANHGWEAQLQLRYGLRGAKTRLLSKRQLGPLTLQRPFYPEGDTCHSYILHPPGGVVAGDSLQISVLAEPGSHSLLTTPGATKFYRSHAQQVASVSQRIQVGEYATVEWLPQQNIFFSGANVALSTSIDIAPGGRFIGWEINCLGRPANGEKFEQGSMRSATQVHIGDDLRLAERLHISDKQALGAATGMRGLAMQASFIAAPCSAAHRDKLEQILQASPGREYLHPIGLTLVDEILVIRALGEQTEPLLQLFSLLWTALRELWLDKAPCIPRIWST